MEGSTWLRHTQSADALFIRPVDSAARFRCDFSSVSWPFQVETCWPDAFDSFSDAPYGFGKILAVSAKAEGPYKFDADSYPTSLTFFCPTDTAVNIWLSLSGYASLDDLLADPEM